MAHTGKRMDVVKKLVEAGADVNKLGAITKEVCDLGYMHPLTPLMIACIQDSSDCVQMLLDARADATLIDAQGHNALHYAAKHGAKLCVDKLLAHGNAAAAQGLRSQEELVFNGLDSSAVGALTFAGKYNVLTSKLEQIAEPKLSLSDAEAMLRAQLVPIGCFTGYQSQHGKFPHDLAPPACAEIKKQLKELNEKEKKRIDQDAGIQKQLKDLKL